MVKLLTTGGIAGATIILLFQAAGEVTGVGEWINLLVQLPLVGVFIWFTLRLMQMVQDEREKRDTEWRTWLSDKQDKTEGVLIGLTTSFTQLSEKTHAIDLSVAKQTAILVFYAASQARSNGDEVDVKEIVEMLQE